MATYQKPKVKKNVKQADAGKIISSLDEGAEQSEHFFEKHRKIIIGSIMAIVVIFLGFQAYRTWIQAPGEKEAMQELAFAQDAFEKDSLRLALDGDPANLGLVKIAERHGSTNAGNIARYLAGAAYYKLGEYEKAIAYLKKYKAGDEVTVPMAIGIEADAEAELGNSEKAMALYIKAAGKSANEFTAGFYLQKAGLTAIYLGRYSEAEKYFSEIKEKYPETNQGKSADKYLEYAKEMQK